MSIPKLFYQSWDEDLPRVVFLKNKNCIPNDFIYKRFSLKDIRDYLSDKWPHVVKLFDDYKLIPHKVDLWRYCILYDTGGIYMDADSILMSSIEPLLTCDFFFVSNNREEHNIFNGFLGTCPQNPIYYEIIQFLLETGPIVKYYFNCKQLYTIINKLCPLNIDTYNYTINDKKMYILWDKLHGDYRFYPYFNNVAILVETNPYYPYRKKLNVIKNISTNHTQNGTVDFIQNASSVVH